VRTVPWEHKVLIPLARMKNQLRPLGLLVAALALLIPGARAAEKFGMPDLVQVGNTCLPTSTANLVLWFGKHGYPKLLLPGTTPEERENHVVHMLMADTDARYDRGTEMERITSGIEKYIHRAGYDCDVEYRGLDGHHAFTQDWLHENDDANHGFVLLLTYCQYHPDSDCFTDAWNAGHAVTLVNAESDFLLIHDPAHSSSETGRKIITPTPLSSGTFQDDGNQLPVAGLLMLSGSLLEAPPQSEVMLTGAVCIAMHVPGSASPSPSAAPNSMLAGPGGSSVASGTSAPPAKSSWWSWIMSFWLGK
jgi:hypothetical protein